MNITNENTPSPITSESTGNSHSSNIAPATNNAQAPKASNGAAAIMHPQEKPTGWSAHIKSAKNTWNKLNEDELLKSDGDFKKLSILVQQRYSISIADAEKQVHQFLSSHKI